jgi:hypothetical protein
MPHPEPWMAALLNVPSRSAEAKNQKSPKTLFGAGKVIRGIHRTQDIVITNLPVKRTHQPRETILSDYRIDLAIIHQDPSVNIEFT